MRGEPCFDLVHIHHRSRLYLSNNPQRVTLTRLGTTTRTSRIITHWNRILERNDWIQRLFFGALRWQWQVEHLLDHPQVAIRPHHPQARSVRGYQHSHKAQPCVPHDQLEVEVEISTIMKNWLFRYPRDLGELAKEVWKA